MGSWLLAVLGALNNANLTTLPPLDLTTSIPPTPFDISAAFQRCRNKLPEEYLSHFKDQSILTEIPKEYCTVVPRECQILIKHCQDQPTTTPETIQGNDKIPPPDEPAPVSDSDFLNCKQHIPEEFLPHFKDKSILNKIPKEYCPNLPPQCQSITLSCQKDTPPTHTGQPGVTKFEHCKKKLPKEFESNFNEDMLDEIPTEFCVRLPLECQKIIKQCPAYEGADQSSTNGGIVASKNLTMFDIYAALKADPAMGENLMKMMMERQKQMRRDEAAKEMSDINKAMKLSPKQERFAAMTICIIFLPTLCVLSLLAFVLVFWQKRYVMNRKKLLVV